MAPERMALLHALAFTAMRLSMPQYDAFTARLVGTLSAQCTDSNPNDADLVAQASERLEKHRATFHRLLGECLQEALLQAVQAVGEHAAAGLANGAMDLSLDSFDVMQRKVLIDNLSQALDAVNAQELAVLSLRIAHWLQAEEIGVAHNPFRSEVFLTAVSKAWSKFDLTGTTDQLVLRQMRPDVFLPLGPILRALNQELAIRNVLPDADQLYQNRKAVPDTMPPPSKQDALRQWLAPEGTLNMIEARAIALFEKTLLHLSSESAIPVYVGSLLVRLRPDIQKLVLADRDFFFNSRHAARRLIDALIHAGLGCDVEQAGDDPLYRSIEEICMTIGHQAEPTPIAVELEALIALETRLTDDRLKESLTDATEQENLSQAHKMVEQEVEVRIESGEVAGFIENFLQTQWMRVLVYARGVRHIRPEVLPNVLKAMDDLIASVQPKNSPEERKALIDGLPALLAVLNAWLNVVKWNGPDREAFFSALAECHAAAMRAPVELSARDQLEIRMNAVEKASEHHLARCAQEQQEEAIAEFMRAIDLLAPGNWLKFVRNNGGMLNCRLLWISPRRSRFIFTGRQGQLLFTMDDNALAHAMQAGRVSVIPTERLIEQALAAASRELGIS